MMQYMTHPVHGSTFVNDGAEVERHESLGWKKAKIPTAADILAMKRGKVEEPAKRRGRPRKES